MITPTPPGGGRGWKEMKMERRRQGRKILLERGSRKRKQMNPTRSSPGKYI